MIIFTYILKMCYAHEKWKAERKRAAKFKEIEIGTERCKKNAF